MDPLKFPNACDLFQIFYNDLTYISFATSSDKLLLNLSEALTFCSHGELPFHSQISYFYIIFIYVNIIISSNAQPRLEQSLPTLGTHKTQLVVAEVCTVYIRKYRLLFKGPPHDVDIRQYIFQRVQRALAKQDQIKRVFYCTMLIFILFHHHSAKFSTSPPFQYTLMLHDELLKTKSDNQSLFQCSQFHWLRQGSRKVLQFPPKKLTSILYTHFQNYMQNLCFRDENLTIRKIKQVQEVKHSTRKHYTLQL